jgi:Tfp pilus assembly protein PilF
VSSRIGVAVALLLTSCLGGGSVTRIVDGRVEEGRAVDEEAYAATLRAGIFDATGDREHALEELERALASDPDSPELLARYGEVSCRTDSSGPPHPGGALVAFSRAIDIDPTYAPAWLGRASCLELLGRTREALVAAKLAAENDPSDPRATELVAQLLFALGQRAEAWAWLDGLAAFRPTSAEAERALLAAALREHDEVRQHLARAALAALGERLPGADAAELADAVQNGDLAAARRAALELHLSSSGLALHLAKAAPRLGLEQADTVLAADPTASDAWIAGLVAADALGDTQRFTDILGQLSVDPLPPSALGLELFGEVVRRHTGEDGRNALTRALAGERR